MERLLSLEGNSDIDHRIPLPGDFFDPSDPERYARLQENAAFFANSYPAWLRQDTAVGLLQASTYLMASALDVVDQQFGRHAHSSPGPQYLENPWESFPTFYHGGDGTRLAILGCVDYMAFINRTEGKYSPYHDPTVYLSSLMVAVMDDIRFGHGRGRDEELSAMCADVSLRAWPHPFPNEMIEWVPAAVSESLFDEKLMAQTAEGRRGHPAVNMASKVSDFWILGLDARPQYAMRLGIENLYKSDTASMHHQILMHKAREHDFIGQNMFDFLRFIGNDPVLRAEYGNFISGAADFGDCPGIFKFADERIENDPHMRTARRENATILRIVGEQVIRGPENGGMSASAAYSYTTGYLYSVLGKGASSQALTPVTPGRDRLWPAQTQTITESYGDDDLRLKAFLDNLHQILR